MKANYGDSPVTTMQFVEPSILNREEEEPEEKEEDTVEEDQAQSERKSAKSAAHTASIRFAPETSEPGKPRKNGIVALSQDGTLSMCVFEKLSAKYDTNFFCNR